MDRPGSHHLSLRVPSLDQVRLAKAALTERAVAFLYDGVIAHGEDAGSSDIFFADPDGIRLGIFAPTGAESALAAGGPVAGSGGRGRCRLRG